MPLWRGGGCRQHGDAGGFCDFVLGVVDLDDKGPTSDAYPIGVPGNTGQSKSGDAEGAFLPIPHP
jgi:hypothetical protein